LQKIFTEWSDDEDTDPERSRLLKEYDKKHRDKSRPQFSD